MFNKIANALQEAIEIESGGNMIYNETKTIEEKIANGETLTEYELKLISWEEVGEWIEEQEYGSGRWTTFMTTIFKIGDQLYALDWQRGLTEYQENEYLDQPYKVYKHEYEKTITITEYLPVENN